MLFDRNSGVLGFAVVVAVSAVGVVLFWASRPSPPVSAESAMSQRQEGPSTASVPSGKAAAASGASRSAPDPAADKSAKEGAGPDAQDRFLQTISGGGQTRFDRRLREQIRQEQVALRSSQDDVAVADQVLLERKLQFMDAGGFVDRQGDLSFEADGLTDDELGKMSLLREDILSAQQQYSTAMERATEEERRLEALRSGRLGPDDGVGSEDSGGESRLQAEAGMFRLVIARQSIELNGSDSGYRGPDAAIESYEWDFDASDGLWWNTGSSPAQGEGAVGAVVTTRYPEVGQDTDYQVTLRVRGEAGGKSQYASDTVVVRVVSAGR